MSKLNPDYKYRFFDGRTKFIEETTSLIPIINDMKECLKSQGVEFVDPYNSILKTVDIYLRIAGISRAEPDAEIPNSIYSLTGFMEFKYNKETYSGEKLTQIKTLFDMINECVDDHHKFPVEDLEVIKNNISTIFCEVVNFLNDVMNFIFEEYSRDGVWKVDTIYHSDPIKDENGVKYDLFGVGVTLNPKFDIVAVTFVSTMLTAEDVDNMSLGVVYHTFSPEHRKKLDKFMGKPEDETEKEDSNADQSSKSDEGAC